MVFRHRSNRQDDLNFLHADREIALEYADGFCTYADRGQIIAKRYGSVNADRWQAEWVLSGTYSAKSCR